ncbi:MAG TPA: SDR family oxidoreductase [Baekduia sp.]|jgi:NAD(P)-dependent dehydrogenase (short-subunit alcohol dehydrogenase family)|nr:SDR family oxidoreductase [Baekduia sp.]
MSTNNGTIAFVTGGNRGLGLAIVDELLARGATKVYATSRSGHQHPDPRVVPVVLDVTDAAAVAAAAAGAQDVNLVVNNAGVSHSASVLDGSLDETRADIETNVFGLLNVSREFAPILAQRDASSLLNVLSALSWFSAHGGYAVSKAAALSATNALRLELLEQGTVVTALHVGYMDTDMTKGLDVEKTDPAAVAKLALDGVVEGAHEVLADDTSRWVKSQLNGDVADLYPVLATA